MKYIKYLLLFSFLVAADEDDMIVIKNGNVFVDGEGFVKKIFWLMKAKFF